MPMTITIDQKPYDKKTEDEKIPTDLVSDWKKDSMKLVEELDSILQKQADDSIAIEAAHHLEMIKDILSADGEEPEEKKDIDDMEEKKKEKADYMDQFMKD